MTFIVPPNLPPGLIVWLPGDIKGESGSAISAPTLLVDRSGYGHTITQSFLTSGGIYLSQLIGGRGVLQMWNPSRAGGSGPVAAHLTYAQSRVINLGTPAGGIWGEFQGQDYSISFWIVSTSTTGSASTATTSDNNPFILSKHAGGGSGTPARRFRVNMRGASNGEIQFTVGGTSTNVMVESATGVNDGNLHHVVCTRHIESGDTRIYIDGLSDASSTLVAGHDSYNTSDLAIGGPNDSEGGTGAEIDGWLGDFRIYNRALSPSEVWGLYDHRTRFNEILREGSVARFFPALISLATDVQVPPVATYSAVNVLEHSG